MIVGCRKGWALAVEPQAWEAPVIGQRTSVGLDVHARSVVGCGLDVQTGEVLRTRLTPAHEQVIDWLRALPGPVRVTYEAGPTGFGLARALEAAGIDCVVAAPSRLLRPSGERVKTDAKDALHLARLLAVGEVTAVAVPDEETEAARDLVRARDDVRGDLMSARHRVTHLLLRQGIVYAGGTPWTREHENWLRTQRFARPALQSAYDAALETLGAAEGRRDRLDEAINDMAAASRFTPVIERLACLRGISTLTGFGLAVEIGDWHRLSPVTIGAYLGLVPGEHSTGESRSQRGVTKTGNSHVRRLLVEAAWHHRPPYRPSTKLQRRWSRAPGPVVAHAAKGNRRLHARWQSFDARRKRPVVANLAIARELAGWCHALAVMNPGR
jgi:transposase